MSGKRSRANRDRKKFLKKREFDDHNHTTDVFNEEGYGFCYHPLCNQKIYNPNAVDPSLRTAREKKAVAIVGILKALSDIGGVI